MSEAELNTWLEELQSITIDPDYSPFVSDVRERVAKLQSYLQTRESVHSVAHSPVQNNYLLIGLSKIYPPIGAASVLNVWTVALSHPSSVTIEGAAFVGSDILAIRNPDPRVPGVLQVTELKAGSSSVSIEGETALRVGDIDLSWQQHSGALPTTAPTNKPQQSVHIGGDGQNDRSPDFDLFVKKLNTVSIEPGVDEVENLLQNLQLK